MKILFLTNNENTFDLVEWLKISGEEVVILGEKIDLFRVLKINPDFIISFNYRYIISSEIVERFSKKIINLHISYLPWNRGANPNLWSFIENTPKGVTIHYVDQGVDTGDILLQKEISFEDESLSLKDTYNILIDEIKDLFKQNWQFIKENKIIAKPQSIIGTFHTKKDFEKIKHLLDPEGWDISIRKLKERLKNYDNNKR